MPTIDLGKIKPIYKGDYSGATAYELLDFVRYNDALYITKQATTGNLPTDTAYWDVITATSPDIAATIHAASTKATPVDADEFGIADSEGTWGLKKVTWSSLKAAISASDVPNAPAGNIAATNVQAAVNELDTEKVAKAGDTMTGNLAVPSLNSGQLAGLRNKIINGNFGISQRAYVSGAATTAGQYTLDRWKVTDTSGVTFSTTANKTTVTIPSGQTLQQVIEGLNLESGTYVLSWEGTAQGRIAGGSYGVSGAVTASITGGTNTTIEFNTGTVALVMLEKGTVATPFEHRPYGMELALCQRYYYKIGSVGANNVLASGICSSASQSLQVVQCPVSMRVTPTTLEQSGSPADYQIRAGATTTVCSAVPVIGGATTENCQILATVASGLTTGQAAFLRNNAPAGYLGLSAEL